MPLIVETGAIVVGANSYATIAEIRARAEERGSTLPADDPSVERLAIRAMDYLEAQERHYQGQRVSASQPLAWPRTGVVLHGHSFPDTAIPDELIRAQAQLAVVINTGIELLPVRKGPARRSVRIGPIAVDNDLRYGAVAAPVVSAVDALLAPLFHRYSGLKVVRV